MSHHLTSCTVTVKYCCNTWINRMIGLVVPHSSARGPCQGPRKFLVCCARAHAKWPRAVPQVNARPVESCYKILGFVWLVESPRSPDRLATLWRGDVCEARGGAAQNRSSFGFTCCSCSSLRDCPPRGLYVNFSARARWSRRGLESAGTERWLESFHLPRGAGARQCRRSVRIRL